MLSHMARVTEAPDIFSHIRTAGAATSDVCHVVSQRIAVKPRRKERANSAVLTLASVAKPTLSAKIRQVHSGQSHNAQLAGAYHSTSSLELYSAIAEAAQDSRAASRDGNFSASIVAFNAHSRVSASLFSRKNLTGIRSSMCWSG